MDGEAWAIAPEALLALERAAFARPGAPIGIKPTASRPSASDGARVAVIDVSGALAARDSFFAMLLGMSTYEGISSAIDEAIADRSVDAIQLLIDSPGGQVSGCSALAAKIAAVRGSKPIAAHVTGTGASAAYWLASSADEVTCESTSVVGSIGCAMSAKVPDGTAVEIVSSQSPLKNAPPTTETGRAEIQRTVDALAEVFVADVASARGVPTSKVLADYGRGGVLVGAAALKAGMVDAVCSVDGALSRLAGRVMDARKAQEMKGIGAKLGLGADASEERIVAEVEALAGLRASLLTLTCVASAAAALGVVNGWKHEAAKVAEVEARIAADAKAKADAEHASIVASLDARGVLPATVAWAKGLDLETLRGFASVAKGDARLTAPPRDEPRSEGAAKPYEAMTAAERHELGVRDEAAFKALRSDWIKRGKPAQKAVV